MNQFNIIFKQVVNHQHLPAPRNPVEHGLPVVKIRPSFLPRHLCLNVLHRAIKIRLLNYSSLASSKTFEKAVNYLLVYDTLVEGLQEYNFLKNV